VFLTIDDSKNFAKTREQISSQFKKIFLQDAPITVFSMFLANFFYEKLKKGGDDCQFDRKKSSGRHFRIEKPSSFSPLEVK